MTSPLSLYDAAYEWCHPCFNFTSPVNAPTISMGRGKIIVEFFSAEMVCRVCKYLKIKSKSNLWKKHDESLIRYIEPFFKMLRQLGSNEGSSCLPELKRRWAACNDVSCFFQGFAALVLSICCNDLWTECICFFESFYLRIDRK